MAPVMRALRDAELPYRFISTGQHRETMDDLLSNFGVKGPDYRLYAGKDITSIPAMAVWGACILWRTLWRRREIFGQERRGIVLVHGDTFSTLVGAIMGRLAGLQVGHVEAGLRSFNLGNPFPEEIVRLLTFRLAGYLFCPGPWAVANLAAISGQKIDTGGNTLLDALRLAVSTSESVPVDLPERLFAVVTLHRFENIYSRPAIERVVNLVERIARHRYLLFILHKPTELKLREFGLYDRLATSGNVEFRQRYDYFRFVRLILAADFVVSDGGSNQEECFYLGKPVLLLRKATERQEGLGENCVLSGYDPEIVDHFVENVDRFRRPAVEFRASPSQAIVDVCRGFAG
jgi:UDP-N-acetylglucosamine 2-epimerase (non-hydrolysing)